jgi:hypothetical protein
MVKVITVLVVTFVVASGAGAQTLTQVQNWNLGLNNDIGLSGAGGSASSLQGLTTLNTQSLGSGLTAMGTQNFGTVLLQSASTGQDQDQAADLILQATPLVQSLDGLGTGSLMSLGQSSSLGTISTPFANTSAPLGISSSGIPWDTQKVGGLGKPWQ